MSKTKKIAVLAIIAMVLTLLPVQLFAADTQEATGRIFGAGRVETALEVCKTGWTSANSVVLAPADQDNLVDALAAAPLAGQENAPILLTFKDALDPAVKAKISNLGAKKVYVVGALSDSVKNEVAGITGVTVEVLKGSSRWETAKAINAKLTSPAGTFVVGYAALADALSVSSFAAANKYAIILADPQGAIPAGQSALGSKTYLVGGTGLVADINGATRIAGADRFETNKKMLETLAFNYDKVYVANGFNNHLVDSLVAAPLAAKYKAPIVLASDTGVGAAADVVNAKLTAATQVIALGGTGVVADSVRDAVKYNTPATFAVESIEPVNLWSFQVVFNQAVDEDTAELVTNYKVNGTQLTAGQDRAIMQSDNKTVLVILNGSAPSQNEKVTLEVRGGSVYNASKSSSAASKVVEKTFTDTAVPTIASVKATGNKKLKVTFSEPVNMTNIGTTAGTWKINGTTLSAMGLDQTNSGPAAAEVTTVGGGSRSNAVTLYFNTALPAGTNTLLVKDGTNNGVLSDGAGFTFLESSKEFTVETMTGNPTVQSAKIVNSKLEITFDRAMYANPGAATEGSAKYTKAYNLNDKGAGRVAPHADAGGTLTADPEFKTGSGDKIVKLSLVAANIQKGVNIITIDKDTKDAWGNKLSDGSDDIRVTFDYVSDTTKPTVTSVSCISDTKVRIQFSKTMANAFLVQPANYKITKSDGTVIFDGSVGGAVAAVVGSAGSDSDTVELDISGLTGGLAGTKFDGSNYTLTVKNLRDATLDANVMDTYTTTFNGIDDYGPNISAVIPTGGAAYTTDAAAVHKAIVYFSEAIDGAGVILDNVGYTATDGNAYNLPSGSSLSLDGTGKMLTVTFPDAYKICTTTGGVLNGAPASDKYHVKAIRVANVKDKNGNVIQGIAQTVTILTAAGAGATVAVGPTFVDKSFSLFDDGDEIRAEFEMKQEVTSLSPGDFRIGDTVTNTWAAAQDVTSGYTVGKKVYLRIANATAIRNIRSYGVNAKLFVDDGSTGGIIDSQNSAGIAVATTGLLPASAENRVYNDQVRPRIDKDLAAYVTATSASITVGGVDYDHVEIFFTEPIDTSILGNYEDDFIFSSGGVGLTVKFVTTGSDPNGKSLRFHFADGSITAGATVNVKADAAKASIRDLKDRGPEDYNLYVPSSADKDGYNDVAS